MRKHGLLFYLVLFAVAAWVIRALVDRYKSTESYVTRRLRQQGYSEEQIQYLRESAGLK
jgi:hypothetical protein